MSDGLTAANDPSLPEMTVKALMLHQRGQLREAQKVYEAILRIHPQHFDALRMMGRLAIQGKNPNAAVDLLRQALQVQPSHVPTLMELAHLFIDIGYPAAAIAPLTTVTQVEPERAEAHNNLGHAMAMIGQPEAALECFDTALRLRADYPRALINRGTVLRTLGRYPEAIDALQQAVSLEPDSPTIHSLIASLKSSLCDWTDWATEVESLRRHIETDRFAGPTLPVLTLIDDPALQRLAAEKWTQQVAPTNTSLGTPTVRRVMPKIRVGYFSADFHDHATSHLIAELLELHDKAQFDILAFSYGPDIRDAMRARLANSGVEFMDVRKLSDFDLCRLARSKELDIAVDLKGHTAGARPGVFALRPAPVAVSYLGYPGTMGAPYVDYLLADSTLIPPEAEVHYTERVLRLPTSYQINDRQRRIAEPASREQSGLPATGLVFACFNNHYKITPEVFAVWMNILTAVDGSILWLRGGHADAEKNLREEAAKRGVEGDRLCFADTRPNPEHLARYHHVDLALDSWPYNAHTTASDALWAGAPMITLMGQSFASRVGASLLRAVDLPELVTHTVKDYETLAIQLAHNPTQLATLRSRLGRRQSTHPLFDTPTMTRDIENIYRSLVKPHG